MKIAIMESIIMPAGHEVEFDRLLINELVRQGHEPILMVPKGFTCKVQYDVPLVYLEGGSIISYAGVAKWKKPFLSLLREKRRREWFTSVAKKMMEYQCEMLIIPTSTYRYVKAFLASELRHMTVPIHFILHGIGKREMNRFIKQVYRVQKYSNVYFDVISLRTDMLRADLPNVRQVLPPVFCPSTTVEHNKNTNIRLGFFGQFRKEKNIELVIEAFLQSRLSSHITLIVQGATAKPEDGLLFESIASKYSHEPSIKFWHRSLIGEEWDQALASVDAILMPYGAERYLYHWSAMLFTSIGFDKPVLVSPEINPEVLEMYHVGEQIKATTLDEVQRCIEVLVHNLEKNPDYYKQALQEANITFGHEAFVRALLSH